MARVWILSRYPDADLDGTLALEERQPRPLGDGEVRIAVQYVSVDPGMRTWIRREGSYMAAIPLGSPMPGSILGRVIETRSHRFVVGGLAAGMGQWSDECVLSDRVLRQVPQGEGAADPLAMMSILGATGWTAYVGMVDIARPIPGDTVVVSAAAGAVGSIAGQLARIAGCRVIGIAGSDEKCAWIKGALGFADAINYRTEPLAERLDALCPDGIDIYFESVGGEIGNAAYPRMAPHGRIALCGLVSGYSHRTAAPAIDLDAFLMKRVRIEGFNVTDHFSRIGEINATLARWIAAGELHHHVELVEGLENCADALKSMLVPGDRHRGKLLVRVASP